MPKLHITPSILEKLREKHGVSQKEVEQCWANRVGTFLQDNRESHRTNPPSLWFVADTNCGRTLKVIFVFTGGVVCIKSAYEAEEAAKRIYSKHGK